MKNEDIKHCVCKKCGKTFGSSTEVDLCLKCSAENVHIHKKDSGKLPWHLLPLDAIEELVKVLDFGREKYAQDTWQHIGPDEHGNPPLIRYEAALQRHLKEWMTGEKTDSESGLSHLAHVFCNAMFIVWMEKHPECNQSGPDIHKEK